ncbi:MAG: hypothetical protein D6820_01805, partial [Lentisphaerae bacterium]
PYRPYDVKDYIDGEFITFNSPEDLAKVKLTAGKNNTWVVKDGLAYLQRKPRTPQKTGSMRLPWALQPGQTLVVEFDHQYQMWYSDMDTTIRLGRKSEFRMNQAFDLQFPGGRHWIAASWRGLGYIKYAMYLTRGEGREAGTIAWKVIGEGYNREGTTRLLPEDAETPKLPITISLFQKWQWTWFNYYGMEIDHHLKERWEARIDKARIATVGIGRLKKELPPCKPAYTYQEPDLPIDDFRHIERSFPKAVLKKLPKLTSHPLDGKGEISPGELTTIKAWLKAFPGPHSNQYNNIVWGHEGLMQDVYRLLYETGDRELLDVLLVWSEQVLEYRNGGPHCSFKVAYGDHFIDEILPGWFTFSLKAPIIIDGNLYFSCDAGDMGIWSVFTCFIEYVSAHPDLYQQKVRAGKDKGKMTYLEKAQKFIDEAWKSIEATRRYFCDPGTCNFRAPWNRYVAVMTGFHLLYKSFLNFDRHGVKYEPKRKAIAYRFVETFLRKFFDPRHFRIFTAKKNGRSYKAALWYYSQGLDRLE